METTNLTFVVTKYLTEDEKKEVLRMIRKLAGAPGNGDYKGRYNVAIRNIWQENYSSRLPFADFQHEIHQWGSAKTKKQSVVHKSDVKKDFLYSDLVKHIIKECGFLPSDNIMNAIGKFWQFSRSIAGSTRAELELKGYQFKPTTNGFIVISPNPHATEIAMLQKQAVVIQDQLTKINKRLSELLAERKS